MGRKKEGQVNADRSWTDHKSAGWTDSWTEHKIKQMHRQPHAH